MVDILIRVAIQDAIEQGAYHFPPTWDTSTLPCILMGERQKIREGTKTEEGYAFNFSFHTFSKSISERETYEMLAFIEQKLNEVELEGWDIYSESGMSYFFLQDEISENETIKHAVAEIEFKIVKK